MQLETILSDFRRIFKFFHQNMSSNVRILLHSDDPSQCRAKASLKKGSPWPSDAIPYKEWHVRGLSDLPSDLPVGPALRGPGPPPNLPCSHSIIKE